MPEGFSIEVTLKRRQAHFTQTAMMQHKSAPGADAERARGVLSRRCNALKTSSKHWGCLLFALGARGGSIAPSAGVWGCSPRWRVPLLDAGSAW